MQLQYAQPVSIQTARRLLSKPRAKWKTLIRVSGCRFLRSVMRVTWCGVISGDEEMHTHNTEQLQPPCILGAQHQRPAILRYVRQGRTFNSDISFSSKHLASIVHHTFHNGLGSLLEFRTDRTDGLLRIKSCAVYIHTVIKKSR